MQNHSDRITRGLSIALAGLISRTSQTDTWACRSKSEPRVIYIVKPGFCTCPDARRGHICKHQWAGPGFAAAALIAVLRHANSIAALRQTGTLYGPTIRDLVAPGYIATARHEYKQMAVRLGGQMYAHE